MEQSSGRGGEVQASLGLERFTDQELIYHHIAKALRDERPIDHATARCIASQLHGGPGSALYALGVSGAVVEGIGAELDGWRQESTPVELEPWLDALDEYLDSRGDPSPIKGWQELWPVQPQREDDEPATGEEERPRYGTSSLAIGRAVVTAYVELPDG